MTRKKRLLIFSGWAFLSNIWQDWTTAFDYIDVKAVDWNDCSNYLDIQDKAALELSKNPDSFVMGWSLGSLAAMEAAALLPGKAKGLLLLNPTPSFTVRDDYEFGVERRVLGLMRRKATKSPDLVLEDFYEKTLSAPSEWEGQNDVLERLIAEKGNIAFASLDPGLEYLEKKDLRSIIPNLKLPMLLLSAQHDPLCPSNSARWIFQHSSTYSSLIDFNDAGHALPFSHFSRLRKIVEDFIHE